MMCRGIRGATRAEENTRESILGATRDLLDRLVEENGLKEEDVAAAFFTTTVDLNAAFPAAAARQMGWEQTALMCAHEMNVPEALSRCIRVMIIVNTEKSNGDLSNVYLKGTEKLREMVV
jgi:chorismate mutase